MQGDFRVPLMRNIIKSQDTWLEHVRPSWCRGVETSVCEVRRVRVVEEEEEEILSDAAAAAVNRGSLCRKSA